MLSPWSAISDRDYRNQAGAGDDEEPSPACPHGKVSDCERCREDYMYRIRESMVARQVGIAEYYFCEMETQP